MSIEQVITEQAVVPVDATIQPPAPVLETTKNTLVEVTVIFLREAEKHLKAATEKYRGVLWDDIGTTKGMEAIIRARAEFRTFRTQILKNGADALKAPGRAVTEVLNDQVKELEELAKAEESRLDKLIKAAEAKKELAKAEEARIERERVAALRARISAMVQIPVGLVGASSDAIIDARESLLAVVLDDMQEFTEEALNVRHEICATLATMGAEKMEAEEEAERQRLERIRQADIAREQKAKADALALQQRLMDRLHGFMALPVQLGGSSAWAIQDAIDKLDAEDLDQYGDLRPTVETAVTISRAALEKMLADTRQAEEERARPAAKEEPLPELAPTEPVQQEPLPALAEQELIELPVLELVPTEGEQELPPLRLFEEILPALERQEQAIKRPRDAELREAVATRFLVSDAKAHEWLLGYGDEGGAA